MGECKEKAQNIDVHHVECLKWAVNVGRSEVLAVVRLCQQYVRSAVPVGRASLGLRSGRG